MLFVICKDYVFYFMYKIKVLDIVILCCKIKFWIFMVGLNLFRIDFFFWLVIKFYFVG